MASTTPYFYIIYNEFAGAGQAQKVWPQLKAVLEQRQIQFDAHTTRYAGHATQLAFQFAKFRAPKHPDFNNILLVVGGDGTLNQALNGLRQVKDCPIPIAYIPCGSGNDFARGVGLSRHPLKALDQVLAATEPYSVDIGHYHESIKHEQGYFVNNIGIGFDAAVVSATNDSTGKTRLNKYHLGSLAYVSSLLKVFLEQKDFPIAVEIDGQKRIFPHAFLVTTTNHPYFGGGVPIMPLANLHDQKLDLIVIEKLNLPHFAFLFLMMLFGKHINFKAVHHFQTQKLQIQTNSLEFGQKDGEEMGSRTFDIHFNVSQQNFWFQK